jgi:hypothetical protein
LRKILKGIEIMTIKDFLVDKDTYYTRLQICTQCDSLQKPIYRCKECGCIMPAKAKLKTSTCPLNKWQDLQTINEQA